MIKGLPDCKSVCIVQPSAECFYNVESISDVIFSIINPIRRWSWNYSLHQSIQKFLPTKIHIISVAQQRQQTLERRNRHPGWIHIVKKEGRRLKGHSFSGFTDIALFNQRSRISAPGKRVLPPPEKARWEFPSVQPGTVALRKFVHSPQDRDTVIKSASNLWVCRRWGQDGWTMQVKKSERLHTFSKGKHELEEPCPCNGGN